MIDTLIEQFSDLEDPRCAGKVDHRLIDILVISVCAVIACAESSTAACNFAFLRKMALNLVSQDRSTKASLRAKRQKTAWLGRRLPAATPQGQFRALALGFRYIDPVLAAYVGEWVTIRYDPRDMAEIRVYYRDTFLCRAVCQELAGETVSLREILGARTKRTRELRQVIRERQYLLEFTFPKTHVQASSQEPAPHPPSGKKTPSRPALKRYECDR